MASLSCRFVQGGAGSCIGICCWRSRPLRTVDSLPSTAASDRRSAGWRRGDRMTQMGLTWIFRREVVVARVFVSHSSADRDVALLVHRRLVDAGHRVFVDVDRVDGIQGARVARTGPPVWRASERGCDRVPGVAVGYRRPVVWYRDRGGEGARCPAAAVAAATWLVHPLLAVLQHTTTCLTRCRVGVAGRRRPRGAGGSGWAEGTNPPSRAAAVRHGGWLGVFFGRDQDRQVVASMLRSPGTDGLIVVVGPSRCGKSPLVRAGVLLLMADHGDWWGAAGDPARR
jgi:Novel STAND NTPase 1